MHGPMTRDTDAVSLARTARRAYMAFIIAVAATPVVATVPADPSNLCDQAAQIASAETGVPLAVLRAIALTETGRKIPGGDGGLSPWPWATNQGGDGSWFNTPDEAAMHVKGLLAAGITNIDLGCFQLNYRWHSEHFASAEDMLDPVQNARYAARMLARLYQDQGDWSGAAGAYHSRTVEFAERYRVKFDAILAGLSGNDSGPFPVATPKYAKTVEPRQNLFPLFQAGGQGAGASLFPSVVAGRRLIGD
jgi:hypothetical protein